MLKRRQQIQVENISNIVRGDAVSKGRIEENQGKGIARKASKTTNQFSYFDINNLLF